MIKIAMIYLHIALKTLQFSFSGNDGLSEVRCKLVSQLRLFRVVIVAGGGEVRGPLEGGKDKIYRFSFKPRVIKEAPYFLEFMLH